jgi:metal-responsive CopG/Arc/MetJ family transcriptional regulator
MRTLIDLPDDQVDALKRLSAREGVSRAALIRRAVSRLLAGEATQASEDAFGLWKSGEDGLAYEDRLRAEW